MRLSLSLLMITACVAVPLARAQTAGTPAPTEPAATQPAVTQPAAVRPDTGRGRRRPRSKEQRNATTGKSDGVLALGATDITGNKELPKVMVIVPWKDSLGAGGVVKPTDSLLDEALQPVDRSVFQRQIHYYGQLHAGGQGPAASKVAPVGDNR